jgi:hypothetical protein
VKTAYIVGPLWFLFTAMGQPPAPPATKGASISGFATNPLEGFVKWKIHDYPEILSKRQASGTPQVAAERLGSRDGKYFFYAERRLPGEYQIEVHMNADEIVHVMVGEAILNYGGTQEGGSDRGNGNIYGGRMVGGKSEKLMAGDMANIPAGMPHQWIIEPGHTMSHMGIQIKKN